MLVRRRSRPALPLVSLLLALVALVSLTGCGTSHRAAKRPRLSNAVVPLASPPTTPPRPPAPPPTIVATAMVPRLTVYSAPEGSPTGTSLSNPGPHGLPLALMVKEAQGDWLRVRLPMRPNGSEGWVKTSEVNLSQDPYAIRVDLSSHQLAVSKGSELLALWPVAVGAPSGPTPTGDFFVSEVIPTGSPGGAYGPYALALSAFSDVYTEFGGGNGQVAIHGTNQPGLVGQSISHGCVRLHNDNVTSLAGQVPAGTPVSIVA